MDQISIQFYNIEQKVVRDSKLASVLKASNIPSLGIAVAVNNSVIPKRKWESFQLHANDAIVVIQATQGG